MAYACRSEKSLGTLPLERRLSGNGFPGRRDGALLRHKAFIQGAYAGSGVRGQGTPAPVLCPRQRKTYDYQHRHESWQGTRSSQRGVSLHLQPAENLLAGCKVLFRTQDGSAVELPWAEMPDGLVKARLFDEKKRPVGEIGIRFAEGIHLNWRFEATQINKAIVGRDLAKRLLGLDLSTEFSELAPGASHTITQCLYFG